MTRCNAKSKQTGKQCGAHVVQGKTKCRYHGGLSCGPRTPEGKDRSRKAVLKHGRYTAEAIEERRQFRQLLKRFDGTIEEIF